MIVSEANRRRDLIAKSLWLVAAAMAVHELEEWNIATWFQRNFSNHTGISDYAVWLGILFITTLFTAWIFLATRAGSPTVMALIALPAVALVAVGNSVQHITWTVIFREYAPGVASSIILVIPAASLAMWRMVQVKTVLLVPLVGCAVLWVVASCRVIASGPELEPFQLVLQDFFMALAESLGLPGRSAAA
ncbi:MAG: HXXEE domain-containing protein [Planctomycetes bacterium]|nr:HXXEE domain-containing protein [Planctomycetota bacterium]